MKVEGLPEEEKKKDTTPTIQDKLADVKKTSDAQSTSTQDTTTDVKETRESPEETTTKDISSPKEKPTDGKKTRESSDKTTKKNTKVPSASKIYNNAMAPDKNDIIIRKKNIPTPIDLDDLQLSPPNARSKIKSTQELITEVNTPKEQDETAVIPTTHESPKQETPIPSSDQQEKEVSVPAKEKTSNTINIDTMFGASGEEDSKTEDKKNETQDKKPEIKTETKGVESEKNESEKEKTEHQDPVTTTNIDDLLTASPEHKEEIEKENKLKETPKESEKSHHTKPDDEAKHPIYDQQDHHEEGDDDEDDEDEHEHHGPSKISIIMGILAFFIVLAGLAFIIKIIFFAGAGTKTPSIDEPETGIEHTDTDTP